MARSAYDRLTDAVRTFVREEATAASPPVERWMVVSGDPLVIQQIEGDVQLEEGDPDVEIDRTVLDPRPEEGDLVHVQKDGADWIVTGVIGGG